MCQMGQAQDGWSPAYRWSFFPRVARSFAKERMTLSGFCIKNSVYCMENGLGMGTTVQNPCLQDHIEGGSARVVSGQG